ncbi:MAG: class I SAM-dependent rRNA methyltransferase [Candidatus Eisenbacteria bacterium]
MGLLRSGRRDRGDRGAAPGQVGDVVDAEGRFLARGTVHPDSQILCRLLTWEPRPIDADFFAERIDRALELREPLFRSGHTTTYRVLNAEGDELPGLIADRYHHFLVVQTLTPGMLHFRDLWLDVLHDRLAPQAIVERGEHGSREPVGDLGSSGVLRGLMPADPVRVMENGLSFLVDLMGGQKTGFYLDQRANRERCAQFVQGRDLLNVFGYTGGFSVYAGHAGARRVVEVETSGAARELARENWLLNSLDPSRLTQQSSDAFEFLRHCTDQFDVVVLDPPPLARHRGALEKALRAYKDLQLPAFRCVRPGGWIFTFSCSQHVESDLFQKVVFGASLDAGARVQWVERLGPGIDHPVHLNHPQGEYLKGMLLRVLVPGARKTRPGADAAEARRTARAPLSLRPDAEDADGETEEWSE